MNKNALSAILMTLFLFISCNNSGGIKEGQASRSDGTVIDLAKVSEKIKGTIAFAEAAKEVEVLVKSIDELAESIGKKIQNSDTLATEANHNGTLIAGAFQIALTIENKLKALGLEASKFSDELKAKVNDANSKSRLFLNKIKGEHSDLGKEGATDAHAKEAIKTDNTTKTKGATELLGLKESVKVLMGSVSTLLESAINELTTPAPAAKKSSES
ncbi:hypothetical protein baBA2_000910 (plasmid) [Borrelia anserina]|nr:Vsp/OspC family lipoprotein [Borrelia anserina]AHX39243.1 variable small protein 1 [Borrelia anserina Es]APR65416.1 Vsp1 [Borrelia anserina Es]UPA07285.1 hypothetical protein baBA2_000910 [Borrelia anserina]